MANSVDDVDADEQPSSWSSDDKKIFEDQLESLQDQLIATMMENQKLGLYTFIHTYTISLSTLQRNKFSY